MSLTESAMMNPQDVLTMYNGPLSIMTRKPTNVQILSIGIDTPLHHLTQFAELHCVLSSAFCSGSAAAEAPSLDVARSSSVPSDVFFAVSNPSCSCSF